MTLSCSTTHSASLTRNDIMPRKVFAASATADWHASSKLTSDCIVTSILRTIDIYASSLCSSMFQPTTGQHAGSQWDNPPITPGRNVKPWWLDDRWSGPTKRPHPHASFQSHH